MSAPWRGPFPWLAVVFVVDVAVTIGAYYALSQGPVNQQALTALALVSVCGAAAMFALAWKIVDYLVVRAIRKMAAETRAIAHGGNKTSVEIEKYRLVSPLPEAVNALAARMVQARKDLADGLDAATQRAEENSARLAAILNDLQEGVVVCNLRHQVVLYNQVAFDMLSRSGPFGLSRSLFETVARAPVVHMLNTLTNRPEMAGHATPFLAGGADGRLLLQARMTLIRGGEGGVTGYVVTLVDAGPQVAALARRDALLSEVMGEAETMLARLRSAADTPAVRREANLISAAVKRLTIGYEQAQAGWWPKTDLLSADLFNFIAGHFEDGAPKVIITGLPVWLHGDSQSLALAVESLIRHISGHTGVGEIDLAAGSAATSYAEERAPGTADEIAWIDILWPGPPVDEALIGRWLKQPLPAVGGMTVKDVLSHHAGAAVSQGVAEGWTSLRLPMRRGVEKHFQPKAVLPTRQPEFYDLSLLAQARDTGAFGAEPLKSLTFVVFDTETTGLSPSAGDQIVQIGAVRVVNGRILAGESFDRIVNPGRRIPPESVVFHGITDEIAKDKPPLAVVLPQFKAFCADAVLVAHNAAFDLKFLRMHERSHGVCFDNPVLDTMILSNYLDGDDAAHSLDAICERFGIEVTDRHTALGDSMVTAAVLLRQIEALEMRGIATLDQAVKALDLTMQLHQRQQAL